MTTQHSGPTNPDESRLNKYLINKCNLIAVNLLWLFGMCSVDSGAIFAALVLMEVIV